MIRFGVVKMGDGTLNGMKDVEGKVNWNRWDGGRMPGLEG